MEGLEGWEGGGDLPAAPRTATLTKEGREVENARRLIVDLTEAENMVTMGWWWEGEESRAKVSLRLFFGPVLCRGRQDDQPVGLGEWGGIVSRMGTNKE